MPMIAVEETPQKLDRPKLSVEGPIAYMRDKRGIQFNIVSEEDAASFLQTSNYYFKLKAFEKNYEVYSKQGHEKFGQYSDLEFAYLQELSSLDMYLRQCVLELSLGVEHFLKVRLLKDVSENEAEDGYSLVDEFLSYHPNVLDKIKEKAKNSYCEHLIDKYSERFSLWTFVEVLSFGDFINLCDYYYGKYPARDIKIGTVRIVKFIRNAAAHNNCLINNLKDNSSGSFTQNREANRIVASIDGISEKVRAKKMGNRTVHDFVVLLYVFSLLASPASKKRQLEHVLDLFENRFLKHKEYFEKNMTLVSNYEFVLKVIKKFAESD